MRFYEFADSGKSTEWVPLDGEGGKAPRIRVPYPVSVLKYEGTRKRQRAARGDYAWSVGDKVDARIRDRYDLNTAYQSFSRIIVLFSFH